MRLIEEMSMNAMPSLQTVLMDGWVLRFAEGYSNRANSVNPIYPSTEDVHAKIEQCEMLYRSRNLRPTYKITPFVHPTNLDELLAEKGYRIIHPTSVQTLNISGLSEESNTVLKTEYEFSEDWFRAYAEFNRMSPEKQIVYRRILNSMVPAGFYATFVLEEQIIGCGLAVLEGDYMGLFDITVAEDHRNSGYGRQLMREMLRNGRTLGAKEAYLQVMLDNEPALHLYKKLGFAERYRYHYRVLVSE